jgi:hypothetical protein
VALVGAGAAALWLMSPTHPPPAGGEQVDHEPGQECPVPPFTESRYLNTGSSARYIGSAACAGCHKEQHQSYLLTAHSRALSDVDPSHEPPDGTFASPTTKRSYRAYRRDGQLRHEETLSTPDGRVIAQVELPARYRIGSGQHARAYAVEVDGFLHESPITWYAATNTWGLSPGYDTANHSFERPILLECLACHAGRAEALGGTINRLNVIEKAIGCESCHGPGSVHQDAHRAGKPAASEIDYTIVHPGKLVRPLKEAICSACHFGGAVGVALRGRQIGEFRPGRPLSDYRILYRAEGANDPMSVVGHAEQMHRSACYQKSSDMTCLSCHDPHERAKPADPVAYYRAKCLVCHSSRPCALDPVHRLKKQPRDNCVACHMPRGGTEVPHVAFTHHRIGLHPQNPSPNPLRAPNLVPTEEPPNLSQPDRERNLGLAYHLGRRNPAHVRYANEFRDRALQHLEAAHAGGLRDAETLLGLAELVRPTDRARACEYAREGLAAADATPRTRVRALTILGYSEFQNNNIAGAVPALEELGRLQRFADDWRVLGLSYLRTNSFEKAVSALRTSVEIRPFRANTHTALAGAYERLGNLPLANEHRQKADLLRLSDQD